LQGAMTAILLVYNKINTSKITFSRFMRADNKNAISKIKKA